MATRQLAAAVCVVALVGAVPLAIAWPNEGWSTPASVPHWMIVLGLISVLHLFYALYMAQLPDWASLVVATLFLLLATGAYAMLAAVRLLVDDHHAWMRFWELDTNAFSAGQEAGWCFIMLLLTGLVAYFAGRTAMLWRWTLTAVSPPVGGGSARG